MPKRRMSGDKCLWGGVDIGEKEWIEAIFTRALK